MKTLAEVLAELGSLTAEAVKDSLAKYPNTFEPNTNRVDTCPLACYLQDATGELVRVGTSYASIRNEGESPIELPLPKNVMSVVAKLDAALHQ